MRPQLCLLLALSLPSCSKKKDEPAAAPPAAPAKPAEAPKPPAPNTPWAFDPAAIQTKLQGAWLVKDQGYLGSVEAWEVKGDQVKMWDAKQNKETTGKLVIQAPCAFEIKESDGSSTTTHFVFDGDTLHMGLGDAGVKQGDKIVACMSNGVFVQQGATCQFYLDMFDKWETHEGTCSATGDTFNAANETFHYTGSMKIHGDVLAGDQLWANTPVKAASYDEAKAKAKG